MQRRSWVKLAEMPSLGDAETLRTALADHDIPCEILNEKRGELSGARPTSSVEVWIQADQVSEARQALVSQPRTEARTPHAWKCASCGETAPAAFAVCWNCGGGLGGAERVDLSPAEIKREAGTPPLHHAPPPPPGPPRHVALAQVGVLLLVYVLPWADLAQVSAFLGSASPLEAEAVFFVYELAIIGLLLYFVRSRGESMRVLGLQRWRWGLEIVCAVPIALVAMIASGLTQQIALDLGMDLGVDPVDPTTRTLAHHLFLPIALLASALVEELVFRSFLFNRLRQIGLESLTALVFCTTLFTVVHSYGPAGLAGIAGYGLAWGVVFWIWGALPRLVIAHCAINLYLMYAPLL